MANFTGVWFTTFGPMDLRQVGKNITGTYGPDQQNAISGKVAGNKFSFEYQERGESGAGTFELVRYGRMRGQYRPEGSEDAHPWDGEREFDGIWESTFGRLRLIQDEHRIHGFYEGLGGSTIDGKITDGGFAFRYQEPTATGAGSFQLSEDSSRFDGNWRQDGGVLGGVWQGRRVLPVRGLTWLVVLEAHWQRSLADNEYAFGHMLREFFARLPNVRVRQRFFHDEASLLHWCRELIYLAEPAILVIASHGSPQGLSVMGKTIDTRKVLSGLSGTESLKLLHFSSCLIAQDDDGGAIRGMVDQASFPISGYTTSVDWGGSALIEFTYLDLILSKHLPPAQAAGHLVKLLSFAGDGSADDSPYGSAGFRFFGKV